MPSHRRFRGFVAFGVCLTAFAGVWLWSRRPRAQAGTAVAAQATSSKEGFPYTNRLIREKSPYLLLHAHNPVDWYPWGVEAFEKARHDQKPVFLSIGYYTCHWCHVMERESYSDPGIAEILNRDFVAIKVDREERPDVDRLYIAYVEATSGSAGWPLNVFLTPDLKPFFGGTYFPRDDSGGRPGLRTLLLRIADAWVNDRQKIIQTANSGAREPTQFVSAATPNQRALKILKTGVLFHCGTVAVFFVGPSQPMTGDLALRLQTGSLPRQPMTELFDSLEENPEGVEGLPLPPTPELIAGLLQASNHVSDLVLAPMRPPQVEVDGRLKAVPLPGLPALAPADTARIARDLLARNPIAEKKLHESGACDLSYFLPNLASFRASILRQRGSYAISMRVIPKEVPNLITLNLPPQLGEIANLKNGIVLATGLAGSGKSSTLAALIDAINEKRAVEIHTIEDPIEFLHPHKRATVLQREVHRDTPSFHVALQAALRHSASVVFVSEMRDRETVELALEAAESGQLVFSALRTTDVGKTLERILGYFPSSEQQALRVRLARNLRYIVSQRLIPRKDGLGREPICEIFISNAKTRGRVEKAEITGKALAYAMQEGTGEGMQCFEDVLSKLLRSGVLDIETVKEFAGDLLEDSFEPIVRIAGLKPKG